MFIYTYSALLCSSCSLYSFSSGDCRSLVVGVEALALNEIERERDRAVTDCSVFSLQLSGQNLEALLVPIVID